MSAELRSFLTGTIALDVMLLVALFKTLTRREAGSDPAARWRLAGVVGLAVGIQGVHFLEEWATGFYTRFPQLFGLYPWSESLWVSFNLVWIAIWSLAIIGLLAGWRAALFPVWFLAIACAVNCVAHPLMALAVGGYFPGLWSSPLCGVVAFVFLGRLSTFTRPVALA